MGQPRHLFVYFRSFQTQILQKNCRRQQDSSSDRRSIRRARWPLDHHHGALWPLFKLITYDCSYLLYIKESHGVVVLSRKTFFKKFYLLNDLNVCILDRSVRGREVTSSYLLSKFELNFQYFGSQKLQKLTNLILFVFCFFIRFVLVEPDGRWWLEWPDLVKFRHFGKILGLWQFFEGKFSFWQNLGPILAKFVRNWENFHWWKKPKIEKYSIDIWSHWRWSKLWCIWWKYIWLLPFLIERTDSWQLKICPYRLATFCS